MTASIAIVTALATVSAFGNTEERSFDTAQLKRIEVKTGSGDIRITSVDSDKIQVTARKESFGDGCRLKMEVRDETLELSSRGSHGWFGGGCEVSFEVLLPVRLDAKLRTGSGDIEVKAPLGEVDVRVGSGDVQIEGEVRKLEARSGNGDISVTGMLGDADIKTGSGNVELKYDIAPQKGTISVKSGSGDATVYLPEATKVQASLRAGSGRMSSELPVWPKAEFRIKMKAGSGNLSIKKR